MATQLLIIEDERQIRENIAEFLTMSNFSVETAEDGQEGILKAMLCQPALILCDVMMPRMDGYQVLELVRSNRLLANVPFIFLTAKADITDMRQGMSLGADDYLIKPFTSGDLVTAINSRLKREKIRETTIQAELEKHRSELNRVSGHEYNTPLTGIMGFANLMTNYFDTFDKAEMISMLEMITMCCLRLKRTLDNVQLTNALRQPAADQFSSVSPNASYPVINNAFIHRLRQAINRRSEPETTWHIDVTTAQLAISEEYLTKIMEELLDNALKFSSPLSNIVVLGRQHAMAYQVIIENQGREFSADNIARIAPYQQFNRDVYEQQGSGLGLYIAKRLIELNKGRLSIITKPDGVTAITVQLPQLISS